MKIPRQNLRIPGPVPCPADVMAVLANPMINHRGPEFKDLLSSVTSRLKRVFMTTNDLYILTGSGTGALEASLVNTLSPGEKVLALVTGSFGQRFADMARTFGAQVIQLDFEWGTAVNPQMVWNALNDDPEIKAVLVTHNETSTGVTNDLESIATIVKKQFDKLFLVDAISSMGCVPLQTDRWGCDVVAASSQKGFLIPPGLSFLSFSAKAWEAQQEAKMPRYYFDVAAAQQYLERGQTPYTPAVSLFYGLDIALNFLLDQGLEEVYMRHAKIGRITREGVKDLGLSLFANESHASNTVTAVQIPDGVDGKALVDILRTEQGVVLAGGQGKLEGKIFRIGHLGEVAENEIEEVFGALRCTLPKVGFNPESDSIIY